MQWSLGLLVASATLLLTDAASHSRHARAAHVATGRQYEDYAHGTGISLRITWEGVTCAIGGNPCDFMQKYLYKVNDYDNQWLEFQPKYPVSVYRYGNDCEFILRDLPPYTRQIRIQLLRSDGDVIADTGPLDSKYQTVIHPFADRC